MKRLLILSHGADTAGCGYALKRAFDTCAPDWSVRQICRRPSPYGYPADILWWKRLPAFEAITREVRALFSAADVIHIMEDPEFAYSFDDWQGKRIVVHHLGTHYRRNPEGISAIARAIGATEVVDMHELLYLPHLRWLPTPQDLDEMAIIRRHRYVPGGPVRIAHAPTNREIKGTQFVLAAVERLAQRYPIEFDLIEKVSNRDCLRRKARADILVDALSLGYAVNAVEGWAMGLPVICGTEYWTLRQPPTDLRERMVAEFGSLPYVEATPDTLEARLEELVVSPALRAEWGERGRQHAYRYHSPAAVVERALALYEQTEAVAA